MTSMDPIGESDDRWIHEIGLLRLDAGNNSFVRITFYQFLFRDFFQWSILPETSTSELLGNSMSVSD